jgi:hypothetical protein
LSIHAHPRRAARREDEHVNTTNRTRVLPAALLLAAATVGTWAAWLSWQTGYRTDPVTETVSGPYSAWQVAGCVVTLAVLAGVAGRQLHPLLVAPVMATAFTAAWAVPAAAEDESGLWLVGAVLVFAGTAAGTTAVAWGGRLLGRGRRRRR